MWISEATILMDRDTCVRLIREAKAVGVNMLISYDRSELWVECCKEEDVRRGGAINHAAVITEIIGSMISGKPVWVLGFLWEDDVIYIGKIGEIYDGYLRIHDYDEDSESREEKERLFQQKLVDVEKHIDNTVRIADRIRFDLLPTRTKSASTMR